MTPAPLIFPYGLSDEEAMTVRTHAMMRNFRAKVGQRTRHTTPAAFDWETSYRHDERGVGAEIAVAGLTGLYWNGGRGMGAADVGDDVEVRSIGDYEQKDALLILHPAKDEKHADRFFVLVAGEFPQYRILGWALGGEVMRRAWWGALTDPSKPIWKMPARHLHCMTAFPRAARPINPEHAIQTQDAERRGRSGHESPSNWKRA